MKLNLSIGECDLVVKHDYNGNKPIATSVALYPLQNQFTLDDDECVGVSYPKHGDHFCYNEGRKYALKSLMRKLEEAGITLNHADKQAVWKIVCPKYYKEKSVTCRKRRQRQKRQEKFNQMVKEDCKILQSKEVTPTTFLRTFILLNICFWVFWVFIIIACLHLAFKNIQLQ